MFELANPWVFLLLLMPFIIWLIVPKAHVHITSSLKVPFFKDLKKLIESDTTKSDNKKYFSLIFLSFTLLILALSGPRFIGPPRTLAHDSYNIMLALDISPSMGINDMVIKSHHVTRLSAVKKAAKQFVQDRSGDKIGLILFGERAYLLTPLTFDRQNVLMRLDDATVGLAGKSTSTGDAIGLAIKKLKNVPEKGRMIILLTDGASNSGVLSPLKAAILAKSEKIKIYTIGLYSDIDPNSFSGMFINANGNADFDEETLKKVAKKTGGKYFRATNPNSLTNIYHAIDEMAKVSQKAQSIRPKHEYYPWPLAFGLLLLIYAIARQSGLNLRGLTKNQQEK